MGSCCSPGSELSLLYPLFLVHHHKATYHLPDLQYYELDTPSFQPFEAANIQPDSTPNTPTFPLSVLDSTAASNPEEDCN